MAHRLEWEPGKWGKGLITDEGEVFTWSTDERFGRPHHAEAIGVDMGDTAKLHMHNQAFEILPDGECEFSMIADGPDRSIIPQADPRLKIDDADGDWHFAHKRIADIGTDISPQLIEHEFKPEESNIKDVHLRRPWYWNPASNEVHVGPAGAHHREVPGYRSQDDHPGFIMLDNEQVDSFDPDTREVVEFVQDYYGIGDEWRLSAFDHEYQPYEGEGWGKGFVDKEGNVYAWAVGNEDGYPSHYDGAQHYLGALPNDAEWGAVSSWFGLQNGDVSFHVSADSTPHGKGYEVCQRDHQLIKQHVPLNQTSDWRFSATDEERRQRWNNAWDGYLERGPAWERNESVEWVPTQELKPYLEWDRDLDKGDYERDLYKHIEQHGIQEPLWLDHNHETGLTHMSEGNHRWKIADELGISHVPVAVMDSRRMPAGLRNEPGLEHIEFKGKGQIAPGRVEPDQHGYVPQYLKPSQIGLPTVEGPQRRSQRVSEAPEPVRIIDAAPPMDYGKPDINEAYAPRRAFWYYPDHNTVYVGGAGMHHEDVMDHYGLDWAPNREPGVVQDAESRGFGAGKPGIRLVTTGWNSHPNTQAVLQQLGNHYNLPIHAPVDTDWTFEANVEDMVDLPSTGTTSTVPALGPVSHVDRGTDSPKFPSAHRTKSSTDHSASVSGSAFATELKLFLQGLQPEEPQILTPHHDSPEQLIEQPGILARIKNRFKRKSAQKMYHVAPAWEEESIAQQGLQPNAPRNEYPNGVYLFHDRDNAEFFAETMQEQATNEYGGGWDANEHHIYEVDASGHKLQPDPAVTDEDEYQAEYPVQPLGSSFTQQPIAPDRIRRVSSKKEPEVVKVIPREEPDLPEDYWEFWKQWWGEKKDGQGSPTEFPYEPIPWRQASVVFDEQGELDPTYELEEEIYTKPWHHRLPILHNGVNAFIGQPGQTHAGLYESLERQGHPVHPEMAWGTAMLKDFDHGTGGGYTPGGEVNLNRIKPEGVATVIEALKERYPDTNWYNKNAKGDWKFSAVDLEPWEPGFAGKGILWNDGQLQTWTTDAEPDDLVAGAPHHSYVEAHDSRGVTLWLYIASNGAVDLIASDYERQNPTIEEREAILRQDDRLQLPGSDDDWRFDANVKPGHLVTEAANPDSLQGALSAGVIESPVSSLPALPLHSVSVAGASASDAAPVTDLSHSDLHDRGADDQVGRKAVDASVLNDPLDVVNDLDLPFEGSRPIGRESALDAGNRIGHTRHTGSLPQVKWYGTPGMQGDHSLWYEPANDLIHIGDPDYHHDDIASTARLKWTDPTGETDPKALWVEPDPYNPQSGSLRADDDVPSDQMRRIQGALGLSSEEDWSFN
jgi:hypothetical protein